MTAIQAIREGDTDALDKMNAVIEQANRVDGKAGQSALAQEVAARQEGDLSRATFGEAAGEHCRPGEPGRFATADLSGSPDATVPLDDALRAVGAHGAVIALRAGYVAPRAVFRVEPGRRYRARFVFQRAEDTLDPANDAVRLGLAWLSASKVRIADTILADVLDVTTVSGRLEYNFAIAREDADDVDAAAPAAGVYVRPFLRAYGSGLTHVEVIEFTDIMSALEWAPDVDVFRRQLAGMTHDVGDLLARVALLEERVAALA